MVSSSWLSKHELSERNNFDRIQDFGAHTSLLFSSSTGDLLVTFLGLLGPGSLDCRERFPLSKRTFHVPYVGGSVRIGVSSVCTGLADEMAWKRENCGIMVGKPDILELMLLVYFNKTYREISGGSKKKFRRIMLESVPARITVLWVWPLNASLMWNDIANHS